MNLLKEFDQKDLSEVGHELHRLRGRAIPHLPEYYRRRYSGDSGV